MADIFNTLKNNTIKTPHQMTVSELRTYALENKLEVVGTGKNGVSTKKDLILAYKTHEEKLQSERMTAAVDYNNMLNRPDCKIACYKSELDFFWRQRTERILRLLEDLISREDITRDNLMYIISEATSVIDYKTNEDFTSNNISKIAKILPNIKQKFSVILRPNDGLDSNIL